MTDSNTFTYEGGFNEDYEWKVEIEDYSADEVFPTVDATLTIGARWGSHENLYFVHDRFSFNGRNKDPLGDIDIALESMTKFRDDISRGMDRLREIKRRLEKRNG